ncbi:MAG: acetate/propionate family kinase [Rickettsiales bacterium]|nr:acetate/propionate family kinase [Rickettsiales bacterium]
MDCILTINAGSSTLKFAIFKIGKILDKVCTGHADSHKRILSMHIHDQLGKVIKYRLKEKEEHLLCPKKLFELIYQYYPNINIKGVGHRIVHGGQDFLHPALISKPILKKLKKLIPLAPLHMPSEVSFVEKVFNELPEVVSVACFDTAFHRTLPRLAKIFAIPRKYTERDGIVRYGFHGLSYEYIAGELTKYITPSKAKRIIVAHLGHGASMCAMYERKSIATSMGFTTLDGLVMGTRCGRIDPGIIIYWMEKHGLSLEDIKEILYKKSGLLGVSGISNDLKKLIASKHSNAKEALDLFCYNAVHEIGALVSILQGLDALIFTGGVGTHSSIVRNKICKCLKWLGLEIDPKKNKKNSNIISTDKSKIGVHALPTDEELVIAKHVSRFIK